MKYRIQNELGHVVAEVNSLSAGRAMIQGTRDTLIYPREALTERQDSEASVKAEVAATDWHTAPKLYTVTYAQVTHGTRRYNSKEILARSEVQARNRVSLLLPNVEILDCYEV